MSARAVPLERLPLALALACALGAGFMLAGCTRGALHAPSGTRPAAQALRDEVPMPPPRDPDLRNLPALPVLTLAGDGYQRGYGYGRAMGAEWRMATDRIERHAQDLARSFLLVPGLANAAVESVADAVVASYARGSSLSADERGYLRGIADGAGIEVRRIARLVAIVMLSDASCSAFVAFGPATEDGRLLQMRNLDWGDDSLPAQRASVLLVHEPPGGQRWLSIGFVGLVGTVSGVNESGISLSEIGAASRDRTFAGTPMPLMLDRVLAGARTLDEAVRILRETPGTGGYNFLVGSARERRGAVVEKTATRCAVFRISDGKHAGGDAGSDSANHVGNYEGSPWFHDFAGFDCRAAIPADPDIRRLYRESLGPGASPAGTEPYEERHLPQVALFESFGRRLDLDRAFRIAEAVAPEGNLQSVVYDVERGRVYVRNRAWLADGREEPTDAERRRLRAATQAPAVVDLARMFPRRGG